MKMFHSPNKPGTAQVGAADKARKVNGFPLFLEKLILFRQKFGINTFFYPENLVHSVEKLAERLFATVLPA